MGTSPGQNKNFTLLFQTYASQGQVLSPLTPTCPTSWQLSDEDGRRGSLLWDWITFSIPLLIKHTIWLSTGFLTWATRTNISRVLWEVSNPVSWAQNSPQRVTGGMMWINKITLVYWYCPLGSYWLVSHLLTFFCFTDWGNPLALVFSFAFSLPVTFIPASLWQAQLDKASILPATSERHPGGEAVLQWWDYVAAGGPCPAGWIWQLSRGGKGEDQGPFGGVTGETVMEQWGTDVNVKTEPVFLVPTTEIGVNCIHPSIHPSNKYPSSVLC